MKSKLLLPIAVVLMLSVTLAGCKTQVNTTNNNATPTKQMEADTNGTEGDVMPSNAAGENPDGTMSDADAIATINAMPGGAGGDDKGDNAAVKTFNVTGADMKFNPTEIRVKKGDKVKINFKSGGWTHDFRIDEFNVATDKVDEGETDTVEFTANKAGTFEYYCSVEDHREMGMVGKLIVE